MVVNGFEARYMSFKSIKLKAGKEEVVLRRHPWIFSGALDKLPNNIEDGDDVVVYSAKNKPLARGFYQDSSIAIKILGFGSEVESFTIDEIITTNLQKAKNFREKLGLLNNSSTNSFRLVHGEGDNIPGLIIDSYNGTYVIQAHSKGIVKYQSTIVEWLCQVMNPNAIVSKSKETVKGGENISLFSKHSEFNPVVVAKENGMKFIVDIENGQKTGFFLDQRENRQIIKNISSDKSILNLCSYSGGFSISALTGGAKSVVSVDSSEKACNLCEENTKLNFQKESNHTIICEDVFKYLENSKDKFDIVICDPPAFAKHRNAIAQAIKGYRRLNNLALSSVDTNGVLATFSCSQVVQQDQFYNAVVSACIDQNRESRLIGRMFQSSCHPVNMFHSEGLYLKGLLLRCD